MRRRIEWASGLFEGEGTILIRKKPEDQIAISLSSTDRDVVVEFCKVVKVGKVYGPYQYGDIRKPYWKWNCDDGKTVKSILQRMLPFFLERRASRAKEVIIRWDERQTRPHYTVSRKGMGGRKNGRSIKTAAQEGQTPKVG